MQTWAALCLAWLVLLLLTCIPVSQCLNFTKNATLGVLSRRGISLMHMQSYGRMEEVTCWKAQGLTSPVWSTENWTIDWLQSTFCPFLFWEYITPSMQASGRHLKANCNQNLACSHNHIGKTTLLKTFLTKGELWGAGKSNCLLAEYIKYCTKIAKSMTLVKTWAHVTITYGLWGIWSLQSAE